VIGVALMAALAMAPASAIAAEGGPGITTPVVLPAYDPAAPACAVPPDLKKAVGFAQDNRRKFIEGVGYGLQKAAADRGLDYVDVSAENDPAKQAAQVRDLIAAKAGAVITPPVVPQALAPVLQQAMWAGMYVGTVVPPPATTILNAPQYLTGKVLGEAAVAYINEHFGGKATVVLLTQDSMQFLAPRFVAIRDALRALPGVQVIADISPNPVNEEGGYATMKIILEAHPRIDVVLGADTVVLGALKALREAGQARDDMFLGGIDGEPDAVAEIKTGGPYKTSIALSSPVFGYALGANAADWLDGKSVPQAMDALPIALNRDNLAAYEADQADPGAVYNDPARRDVYLKRYGNICYDTRDQYLNFPWSSEG
jgi:ribose transport system substrate-binding protein